MEGLTIVENEYQGVPFLSGDHLVHWPKNALAMPTEYTKPVFLNLPDASTLEFLMVWWHTHTPQP